MTAADADFRRFEFVWYQPDADSSAGFRAGGAYRVMFEEADAESPELFAWVLPYAHGRVLVRRELLSKIERDRYGNPLVPR